MIEAWIKAVIGISAILCGWLTVQLVVAPCVTAHRLVKTPWPDDLAAKVASVQAACERQGSNVSEHRSDQYKQQHTESESNLIGREQENEIARLRTPHVFKPRC